MADWFKFYENDLDETRLQYAISKLPEVVLVWVGILSECCRHKSDTIRWGSNEIELFGFSRRLGISIPKVNEAVNLLCEIEYISIGKDTITVIKWVSKQSEYCQKKAKCRDTVGTLSVECRPRGEERRGDKKRIYSPASRAIIHFLNERSGKKFRETSTNLGFIDARLSEEGVDLEGVKKMVERQVAVWKGTEMDRYLRPETLFNQTKFDTYYANKDQPIKNEINQRNPPQRVDRSIGTANEGTADQYRGLGRVVKNGDPPRPGT